MKFSKRNILILTTIFIIFIFIFFIININFNDKKNNTSLTWTQQNQFQENKAKELTIQDKLNLFISEKEALNKIKLDWTYLEEIPRIETYYKENAFYEFYLLLSVKTNDILKCDNIKENKEKELCKSLFLYQNNKDEFISIYKKNGESIDFANSMYNIYLSIKSWNCNSDNIITYLGCKKIFNKDIDIKNIFVKYSILEYSNLSLTEQYYKDLSKFWRFDNSFNYFVENTIIK